MTQQVRSEIQLAALEPTGIHNIVRSCQGRIRRTIKTNLTEIAQGLPERRRFVDRPTMQCIVAIETM